MFRLANYVGSKRDVPRSIVVYNYYYGFSPGLAAVEHETHTSDSSGDEEIARFFMPRAVYEEVIEILGSVPPEACGMLLGPKRHGSLITHFVRDESGASSPTMFRIDGERMTEALKPYLAAGLDVKGICHSHPSGCYRPSDGDLTYLRKLFANHKNASAHAAAFYFPIISDGQVFHFAYDSAAGKRGLRPAKLALL